MIFQKLKKKWNVICFWLSLLWIKYYQNIRQLQWTEIFYNQHFILTFSGSNSHLHNPYNPVSHSPGLPQFGLHSTSHGSSSFSSLPPSPLHNIIPPTGPQSMFAAPLPPGAANGSLTSPHALGGGGGGAGLSAHASPESMSLASKSHYCSGQINELPKNGQKRIFKL